MTKFHMLKKLKERRKERLNILRRNILIYISYNEVIEKAHIKTQEMKILISVIKSSLDEINVAKINVEKKRTWTHNGRKYPKRNMIKKKTEKNEPSVTDLWEILCSQIYGE